VRTVEEGDSFHDAAIWMIERGIGSAVVLKDGTPTGIITDRDALRVIARGSDIASMTVRDCVTRGLKTVSPSLDLQEAAKVCPELTSALTVWKDITFDFESTDTADVVATPTASR